MLLKNRISWHLLEKTLFLCLCFLAKATSSNNLTCHAQDFTALLGFLNGLKSGIRGWGSDSDAGCCTWDGVTCEFVHPIGNISLSRVVGLELPHKGLVGKLNRSLAGLDYLRVLNLSNNFFWDYVPLEIFSLEFLEVLDLSSNNFNGNITMEISLPSLKFLDLSHNLLQGLFNKDICGVASRLQVLDLSMNSFTYKIPPTIGNCSFLEVLSLGSNLFEGNFPNDLFQLSNLRQLTVQDNLFAGLLSPFGNLTSIVEFDISLNNFVGTLPDSFYNLRKLRRFSASSNRFIGSLPPSLSNSPGISLLSVRNNSLSGSIVLNCSAMVSLTSLALASNSFDGPIPGNLSSCKQLTFLDLSKNMFGGELPESFKKFSSLSHLSISNCSLVNLGANLDILQHCKNLRFIDLTHNFHGEKIPTDIDLNFNSLSTLVLADCQLTGLIPNWLQSFTNLQVLDLSWNRLTGPIPNDFSKLKLLFYLDLSRNMLSEGIPKGLTTLQSLINQNNILDENLEDLEYNQIPIFPSCLDLSSNYLTGPIPAEFGNLKQLQVLNLNNNRLSGQIPETLSNITSLAKLNLSYNSLIGEIPPSIAKLIFLSAFSVAFNKLSGHIPTGGLFETLPNSSFAGNENLFGYEPSSHPSVPEEKPRENQAKLGDGEDPIIGLPFAIGSVTTFVIVVFISYLSGWLFPKERSKKYVEIAWRRIR
ncbi:hypothetical protein AgCh_002439 [Apium graveolens]